MTDMKERGHAQENITNIIKDQGHALLRSTGSTTDVLRQTTHRHLHETRNIESTERDLIQMTRKRRARGINRVGHSKKRRNARCKLVSRRPACSPPSSSPIPMPLSTTSTCPIMRNLRKTHLSHQSQLKLNPR
jgi:hypothetical protein